MRKFLIVVLKVLMWLGLIVIIGAFAFVAYMALGFVIIIMHGGSLRPHNPRSNCTSAG